MSVYDSIIQVLKYVLTGTIAFDAVVAMYLFMRGRTIPLVKPYFLTMCALVIWEIFFWLQFFLNNSAEINLIVNKFEYIFGLLATLASLFFLNHLFTKKIISPTAQKVIIIITCLFILGIAFGPIIDYRIYTGIDPYNYDFPLNLWRQLYYFFLTALTAVIIYLVLKLKIHRSNTLNQSQIILIRTSMGLCLVVVIILDVVIPAFSNYFFVSANEFTASDLYVLLMIISAISTSIWTSVTAYALIRHRLFDIRIIFKRSWVQAVLIFIFTLLIAILALMLYYLFGNNLLVLVFTMIIGMSVGQWLFVKWLSRYLTNPLIDLALPQTTIRSDIATVQAQLVKSLRTTLADQFGFHNVSLLFLDRFEQAFIQNVDANTIQKSPSRLSTQHALIYTLRAKLRVLMPDEIRRDNQLSDDMRSDIVNTLERFTIATVVPLHHANEVYGLIFIHSADLYPISTVTGVPQPYGDIELDSAKREKLLQLGQGYGQLLYQQMTYQSLMQQYATQA